MRDTVITEEVYDLIADAGRIEVRLALLDWIERHVWWHFGLALGLAGGAVCMVLSGGALWSQAAFWLVFCVWKIRSDHERALLMKIAGGER